MSWGNAFEQQQAELDTARPARAPATLGEVWDAAWDAGTLDTISGLGSIRLVAQEELRARLAAVSGRDDVAAAARARGFEIAEGAPNDTLRQMHAYIDTLDPAQREQLAPYRDVAGIAVRRTQEIERRAAETSDRTYGLSGYGTAFLAGLGSQMADPVTIATLPFGAARGVGFGRMLLQEAAIGAAATAVSQPSVQQQRAGLGLDSGLAEALGNVAEGAFGNAAFAGTLRLAGMGLAAARARIDTPDRQAGAAMRALADRIDWAEPADFEAAAHFFERQDVFGRPPVDERSAFAAAAHREVLEEAALALEHGRGRLLNDNLGPAIVPKLDVSDPVSLDRLRSNANDNTGLPPLPPGPVANDSGVQGRPPGFRLDTNSVPSDLAPPVAANDASGMVVSIAGRQAERAAAERAASDAAAQARFDAEAAARDAARPKKAPARGPGALLGDAVPGMAPHRVATANGASIDVAPIVVEARDLRTSADDGYDPTLQPRNRDRAASQAQIAQIAGNLDPARLGVSAEADRGAPIVGGDGQVESGNGRLLAIRQAYAARGPQAAAYRKMIADAGVDVRGFDEPVLVRQRRTELTDDERRGFTLAANQQATLTFSAPERAQADARAITPAALDLLRNTNDLSAAGNADFVQAFLRGLPATEHGMVATPDGRLSAEGLTRVRNAVLARAYGDDSILGRVAESADDHVRSLSNALVAVAPEWARLRADVEAGRVRPDVDTTRQLVDAVNRTADLRARGGTLDAYLGQIDAFDPLPLETARWMELFVDPAGTRAASQERIATIIRTYAEESRKVSTEVGFDLGLPAVTIRDLQDTAARKAWADVIERSTQGDLLGGQSGLRARDGADRGGRRKSGDAGGGDQAGGAGAGGDRGRPADDAGGSAAADGADAGRLTDARILPADPAERDRTLRAADVERRLAETPDMLLHGADGTTTPAADALKRAADEKTAADELADCLLKPGPGGDAGGAA